jgi:integrase/recombinase XerD
MTATMTTTLVPIQPVFSDAERLALAGFLAGYRGLTREAYALDLRQFTTWCRARSLNLFSVRRPDIEGLARDLEARARATVTRRAVHHRRVLQVRGRRRPAGALPGGPRPAAGLDYESHAVALDRNELGALPVAAGLGPPAEHALMSLLALNGLRVSEATGADIEHLGLDRGHRTLTITRKGGKVVTIPLARRTARAIDLAIGEREPPFGATAVSCEAASYRNGHSERCCSESAPHRGFHHHRRWWPGGRRRPEHCPECTAITYPATAGRSNSLAVPVT